MDSCLDEMADRWGWIVRVCDLVSRHEVRRQPPLRLILPEMLERVCVHRIGGTSKLGGGCAVDNGHTVGWNESDFNR